MTDAEDRPTFSMVFVTWNAADVIGDTLASVREQTVDDYEVVIADNDSSDETLDVVRDAGIEDITVVENESNLGFTRGINRGIDAATGEYICCYNHDTLFPDSYLATLAETVSPDAVWTTARTNYRVSTDHRTVRLLSKYRFTVPYLVDGLDGVASVNYVPGDGVIVPRNIYDRVLDGLVFDPALPPRTEDMELGLRLRNADVPMRVVLDTHSIHPDRGDRYAPTLQNFLDLLETTGGRIKAHRINDRPLSEVVMAATSVLTMPLVVFFGQFPRSETAFLEHTEVYE